MSNSFPLLHLILLLTLLTPSLSQQSQFIYKAFSSSSSSPNLTLDGISQIQPSGILQLTNTTSRLLGHAFYPTPLTFKPSSNSSSSSFSTSFAFAIVPEYPTLGGHGFAFIISPDKHLLGAQPSQFLGFLNASDNTNFTDHIFAIEFDTVQDFEFFDISDNHIGIDINNLRSNQSANAAYYDDSGNKQDLNLKGGGTVLAWIDYDGVNKVINITVSPFSKKPAVPLITYPLDLSPILQNQMYVGFSASTGLLASSHYLMGWSFKMNGVAQSLDLSSLPSLPIPKNKKSHTTLVLSVSFSALFLLTAAILTAAYLAYKIKNADIIEPWEFQYGPHRFSYSLLKQATNKFRDSNLLGFGGFGKVYKGTLPDTKAEVAVKRVSHGSKQGLREFVAEIASIGRLRHRNLVRLQGWCRRRADLLLVYDYMPNGSLDKFLFVDEPNHDSSKHMLSWEQRYRILKGVASALLYLHEQWEHVVIHRDVKASNVLIDGELNGRLGDFGLAKLYEHGANPSTTRVVGTLGYLAPELTRTGKATTGSDVFAFGALVLEVVCGRRPIEPKATPEELVLVDWVWEKWSSGKWVECLDPRMDGFDMEEAELAVKVGLVCSHPASCIRPSMREVVRYLDGGDAMEVPEVRIPSGEYEGVVRKVEGIVGFEDFVHSYPSSSFEKVEAGGEVTGVSGVTSSVGGPFSYSPLSLLSRGSV